MVAVFSDIFQQCFYIVVDQLLYYKQIIEGGGWELCYVVCFPPSQVYGGVLELQVPQQSHILIIQFYHVHLGFQIHDLWAVVTSLVPWLLVWPMSKLIYRRSYDRSITHIWIMVIIQFFSSCFSAMVSIDRTTSLKFIFFSSVVIFMSQQLDAWAQHGMKKRTIYSKSVDTSTAHDV